MFLVFLRGICTLFLSAVSSFLRSSPCTPLSGLVMFYFCFQNLLFKKSLLVDFSIDYLELFSRAHKMARTKRGEGCLRQNDELKAVSCKAT